MFDFIYILIINKMSSLDETQIISTNKVISPGTVTAYDQNNLLITLLVERDQMNIDSNTVNMTAYNNGTLTINEFLFQAAVPKVSFIKINEN